MKSCDTIDRLSGFYRVYLCPLYPKKQIPRSCETGCRRITEDLMQIAIGIILIISALFLIVAVLMQHGKSHNLSGTIAGGAETFFGKTKGSTLDRKLSKLTTIVAIVFCVLVLASYLIQDTTDFSDLMGGSAPVETSGETVAVEGETTADAETSAEAEGEAAAE